MEVYNTQSHLFSIFIQFDGAQKDTYNTTPNIFG